MISTQEEWRQPGTGAWLGGAGIFFCRDKGLAHEKRDVSTPISQIYKKIFEQIDLSAKLLHDFL